MTVFFGSGFPAAAGEKVIIPVNMKDGVILGTGKENPDWNYSAPHLFMAKQDLSSLEGSVLWICPSPYRPHHKRKNWYVDVSVIPEAEPVCREGDVIFEKFHCGGKGGQNVNKVETGVRLIHRPTGITVTSTEERSQYLNKKKALLKLEAILQEEERKAQQRQIKDAWKEHAQIVRGNPVRIYTGMEFRRKK